MLLELYAIAVTIQEALTPHEVEEPEPFLVGTATRYDYSLTINGSDVLWSRSHNTCAVRVYERYQTYLVCSDVTGKCIECYHNDYWPAREDRVIDLSSHAFQELWVPLSRGVTPVKVFTL